MRYSEAVKRHKLETKQRIFNSILEAAEKEKFASPSADNSYGHNYRTKDTERETKKKETITMRSTQINEVRSRKGGVIAAACAILLIGGGISTLGRSTDIDTYDMKKTSTASSSVSSAETSSAEEKAVLNTTETVTDKTEPAVTAETSSAEETAVPVEETTTSAPDTVVPEITPAKVTGKTNFNDLLASSNTVYLGTVSDAEAQTLEMPDGSVKNVISYTLGANYFTYDIGMNRLREFHNAEVKILHEVNEGTEPLIKIGETAIFMTGEATLADLNGAFIYDNLSHQLFGAAMNNDSITLGMYNYMLNVILDCKDITTVRNWFHILGENVDDSGTIERSDLPTDTVDGIFWSSENNSFSVTVNANPDSEKLFDVMNRGNFTNVLGTQTSQKISGFDDVDIEITSIGYSSDMTAAIIHLTATPKNGFAFDPGVLYKLSYDRENAGIWNISWALNTDATMISEGLYYPVLNCVNFEIMFDQAGTDGEMEFDVDNEFTFTINGISANDSNYITGEYKFNYTYNPSAVESVGNARIVTPETATNTY